MQTIIMLAETSPAKNQFFIGSLATLIGGLLFLMVGYYIGWLFLRRWQANIERIESDNRKLARILDAREHEQIEGRNSIGGHN